MSVGDYLPSAQNIVSIFGTGFWDMAIEDNLRSLIDSELSAFDEVREICFEKRKCKAIRGAGEARHRRGSRQLCKKALK